jgi:hypothetical protein
MTACGPNDILRKTLTLLHLRLYRGTQGERVSADRLCKSAPVHSVRALKLRGTSDLNGLRRQRRNLTPIWCHLMAGAAMTASVISQVNATPSFPEANYQLVYDLSIPNSANYLSSSVPYSVINTASISNGSYARVGYMLQLQTAIGSLETVAVSMDAFTTNPSNLGVPTVLSGEVYNEVAVTNMNVTSNVPGVAVGTGLSSGYLQFWPDCYNHSGGVYATGFDTISAGSHCYGSMQIGNGLGNTVFAYNSWDGGGGDVGIGNQATGNPDWTFAHNASSFVVEDLSIWVSSSVPEPASIGLLLGGLGVLGLVRRRAYKHTS